MPPIEEFRDRIAAACPGAARRDADPAGRR